MKKVIASLFLIVLFQGTVLTNRAMAHISCTHGTYSTTCINTDDWFIRRPASPGPYYPGEIRY